jgi:hypothetical protein
MSDKRLSHGWNTDQIPARRDSVYTNELMHHSVRNREAVQSLPLSREHGHRGWKTDHFRVSSAFYPWPQTFLRVIGVIGGFQPAELPHPLPDAEENKWPKDVILTASYSGPAPILLRFYWRLTPIPPFKTQGNRRIHHVSVREKVYRRRVGTVADQWLQSATMPRSRIATIRLQGAARRPTAQPHLTAYGR